MIERLILLPTLAREAVSEGAPNLMSATFLLVSLAGVCGLQHAPVLRREALSFGAKAAATAAAGRAATTASELEAAQMAAGASGMNLGVAAAFSSLSSKNLSDRHANE